MTHVTKFMRMDEKARNQLLFYLPSNYLVIMQNSCKKPNGKSYSKSYICAVAHGRELNDKILRKLYTLAGNTKRKYERMQKELEFK